jgi:hypothetical protein
LGSYWNIRIWLCYHVIKRVRLCCPFHLGEGQLLIEGESFLKSLPCSVSAWVAALKNTA